MCANMKEFQAVSEKIFELEQKKARKKKEMNALENNIKQLKEEASSYMRKRKKSELIVEGFTVLLTEYERKTFDKDAFIEGEEDGKEIYNKYMKKIPMKRVTVKLAMTQL